MNKHEYWAVVAIVALMLLYIFALIVWAAPYPNLLIYGEDGKLKARCYNTPMATPTPTPSPTNTPTPCPTQGAA